MATPEGFQAVAKSMLNGPFAAFKKPAVITTQGTFDHETQTATTATQTVDMIKLSFDESKINGTLIKRGDFQLIGERAAFTWLPDPESTSVLFDGKKAEVVYTKVDAAEATVLLHLRCK